MTERVPAEIRLRRRELTILRWQMSRAAPREGCALLLGCRDPDPAPLPGTGVVNRTDGLAWDIRLIWPCLNVWEPADERARRFGIDPREQLLAQRWARLRGWQVLGAAHSHPLSPALPSETDLALACCPCLQLIVSPLQAWRPRCWWLSCDEDGKPEARPLQWRMVD